MTSKEDREKLLIEIKELESEIEEMKKRIPPHSVRYEMIQLLEEKEQELQRNKLRLTDKKTMPGHSTETTM
jgi:cell division septum initiation protein DivIVA